MESPGGRIRAVLYLWKFLAMIEFVNLRPTFSMGSFGSGCVQRAFRRRLKYGAKVAVSGSYID